MSDIDGALTASHLPGWAERRKATERLGEHLDDPRVRQRLTELLDDANTAVGEMASAQLVAHGGLDGLARAAEAFAYGDDNAGYRIADAITGLRFEGFPVDDAVNDLLRSADTPRSRRAAEELAHYLRVERR